MYKDEQKQKEANRVAAQRRRDKAKGMTIEQGMTEKGMTNEGMTEADRVETVTAKTWLDIKRKNEEYLLGQQTAQTPVRTRTEGCKCALPGDEDYVGVCVRVAELTTGGRYPSSDVKWRVKQDIEPTPLKTMTRQELELAIRAYPNDQWVNSPEHKELMRRLNLMSAEELEQQGYLIPAGKRAG